MSLIVIVKYMAIFRLNTLSLGLLMMALSFRISLIIGIECISWFGLIFFIVYIGGLLVLFIYVSSLNYNPVSFVRIKRKKFNFSLLFLVVVLRFFREKSNYHYFSEKDYKNFRFNLFKGREVLILISIGIVLLLVLWVIGKITFQTRGALRPLS